MNPSQVRKLVLQEHTVLRGRLHTLESAVDALRVGRAKAGTVASIARSLLESIVAHTQLEDALLAPALREIDAWGTVRADLLLDHHAQQRAQLRALVESYRREEDCDRLARITLDWVRDVRIDMLHEETDVLNAALLKDDPIAVGMESG